MASAADSSNNTMQSLQFVSILYATITVYILMMVSTPLVHCEYDQIINCTEGCLSFGYAIFIPFHCPVDCNCILGNQNVSLACHGGETSLVQVLYPRSDFYWLSWSDTGIHEIEQTAFEEGFTNLQGLFLANNNIVKLHPQQFAGVSYLVFLDISNNDIAELHPQQFADLTNLRLLNLSNNDIVELHPQQFAGLSYMEWLYLSNNDIVELHPQAFAELTGLWHLDISNNNIMELMPPQQFEGLSNLELLDLSNNDIVDLHPQQFADLTNLWTLLLSNNDIVELHPQQFAALTNLLGLTLSNNAIVEMHPRQFAKLTVLGTLDLSNNDIAELHPQQFVDLTNLRWLLLSNNDIVKLHPQQFAELTYLWNLDLSNNNIMELPPQKFAGLSHMVSLYMLYLSNNDIVELHPQQFAGLSNLELLDLSNNYIVELHPQQFADLTNLRLLLLSNNDIVELHPKQFEHNSILGLLYMSNNLINVIYPYILLSNTTAILDLSINNLIFFQLSKHVQYSMLVSLLLSKNKLSTLPNGAFQNMKNLKYLDLSNNYFNEFESMAYFATNSLAVLDLLDLRSNMLQRVTNGSFQSLQNSTQVLFDNAATCCFIESANCTATIPPSQFLTCGRLLSNQVQRINMWLFGIFAIISNVCALVYRCRQKPGHNKVQMFLISNLSLSDLIMGIYMLIIVSADLYYQNTFPSESWRASITCKVAGTLSMLSSEASIFFITIISIDRLMGIRYMYSTNRLSTRSARVVIAGLWVFAIALSITSTVLSQINPALYDISEVCTGLPLSRSNTFGTTYWQYDTGFFDIYSGYPVIYNNTLDTVHGTNV